MKSRDKLSSEAGVTLVELMVVALIIIIVATIAFLNAGTAHPQFQRQNATRQLKAALERARFDSVKRRAVNDNQKASVTIAGASFILTTDVTLNGLTSDPSDSVTTFADTGISIQRYDGATLDSTNNKVVFNMRGEVPTSPAAQFLICNGTCPAVASLTPSVADILIVTPTGTVNLLPGTPAALPTFTDPTLVGSTSATADVNPDVTVP